MISATALTFNPLQTAAMASTLRIQLLDKFALVYDNRPLTDIHADRLQALLAYLVLHQNAAQRRQHLAFLFWPEATETEARANLRRELYDLRRALPQSEQFLLTDAKTLQWRSDAPFVLDIAEFEHAIRTAHQATDRSTIQAALETAARLYQGNLLPTCDDEWIVSEREQLRQRAIQALEQLSQLLQTQGDYRSAIRYVQQWLKIDPLNESAYGHLMRLYGLSGDRATALQVYYQCMSLLREELGIDPSATIRKLYEDLLNAEDTALTDCSLHSEQRCISEQRLCIQLPPQLPAKPALLPLVGRDREWQTIQYWLNNRSENGICEPLFVLGEPGIGKTRLLEEIQASVQSNHEHVLWGRGFEAEMVRPYGAWIDALRSLSVKDSLALPKDLGLLLPELGNSFDSFTDRSRLFDAVVHFLTQLSSQTRLLVVLDDIQWLDEASVALLHYATRLLNHTQVQFACAARSKVWQNNLFVLRFVQALQREGQLQKIELCPLEKTQTKRLIDLVHCNSNQPIEQEKFREKFADQVFVESGGNPLFALEVARVLSQHQTNSPKTDLLATNLSATNLPETLESLIQARLQLLDNSARQLLSWAAAMGHSFKSTTLAHVAEYSLNELLTALEQLEQHNIIRPGLSMDDQSGYDFAHDIVRQVAYQQFSVPRRQLVHLQIAHKLNQLLPSDHTLGGDIAHHAALGGDHPLAASAALAASRRYVKQFAYTDAFELAQRGIDHCQFLDMPEQVRLHLELLQVQVIAGVNPHAASQLKQILSQLTDKARMLGLTEAAIIGFESLTRLSFEHGDFAGVHQHLLQATGHSQPASLVATARQLAWTGSCFAEIGQDMHRAEALLLEAQALAERVELEIADVFIGLGAVYRHGSHIEQARKLLSQAWRIAHAEADFYRLSFILSYSAMLELEAGNPTNALPYCRELIVVAEKLGGGGSEAAFASALEALAHYAMGQEQAEIAVERSLAQLRQIDAKRMLSVVLTFAAEIDFAQHRPELAVVRAEEALKMAQGINHPSEMALAWTILLQGQLALGETHLASERFQTLQQTIDRSLLSVRARSAVDRVVQLFAKTSMKKVSKKSSKQELVKSSN